MKTSCVLSWQPPSQDGGTPIIGYHVERTTTKTTRWVKVNRDTVTDTTLKMDDLVEETEYKFRVIAENKVGCGPESEPSEPVLAKDPWGKSKPKPVVNVILTSNVLLGPVSGIYHILTPRRF